MNPHRPALYLVAVFCLCFGLILPVHPALAEDITYPGNGTLRADPFGWLPGNISLFPDATSGNSVTVRPIITGRVYHELNRVHYDLPGNKTRTVFKSMSTPGKEGEDRGFNELRIEDKKGEEEIYVHAEKDVNVHVKNDWKELILNEKNETVDKQHYTRIKDEDHLIVHKDSHSEYKTKWLAKAGEEIHFKSGDKIVMGAGDELTFKVGSSFVKLTSGEVTIVGDKVKINAGGTPSTGTDIDPEEALLPGESPKPKQEKFNADKKPLKTANTSKMKASLLHAQKTGQSVCEICG